MNIKRITILIVFISVLSGLTAQSISNLQFPPSISWKKIETKNCILIFPEELSEEAGRLAGMVDLYFTADEASLNTSTSKWPIIINNSLVQPNAYVATVPKHSQFYTIPDHGTFSGTSDWIQILFSHEIRHIVQNEKMLRGFTWFARFVGGEYGWAIASHMALPPWVWEGDAVLTETLLGSGGRGRLASFERLMRFNTLNGIRYRYPQASLGSYSSYLRPVPSWYVSGYHLSAYIRKTYGLEAFNRILEISAEFSFVPLIVNIAVKNVTGKSICTIYQNCLDELEGLWSEQLADMEITDSEIIKEGYDYTNYYPLGFFDDGSIAAYKQSLSQLDNLVRIYSDGTEERLRKIAPYDKNISFNGTTFCWAETQKDIRWGNRSWTVIRKYNPETGEYRLITNKTRYLSPSISPDGSMIAAVEIDERLKSSIVIIDSETGSLISKHNEPQGASPMQTCWTDDGKSIVYIRKADWMKSLCMLTPSSGANIELTKPSPWDISSPFVSDGCVFFVSEESGLENIHSVDIPDGSFAGDGPSPDLPTPPAAEPKLIVSRPYGTASPAADRKRLLFSDYTASGWSIASVDISRIEDLTIQENAGHVDFFEGLEYQEPFFGFTGAGKPFNIDKEAAGKYKIEDYHPALGLFNFHSPAIGYSAGGPGITLGLKADSIMNDSSGVIYTGIAPFNNEAIAGFAGAWAGFFPVLLYGAEIQTAVYPDFGAWLDTFFYTGVELPFDFSSGVIDQFLNIGSIIQLENRYYPTKTVDSAFIGSIRWQLYEKSARRDIIPPLGISLYGKWMYSIISGNYNFIFGECKIFLPSIFENHGFKLVFQVDYNHDAANWMLNPAAVPRGLNPAGFAFPLFFNAGIDYTMPLAYPDIEFGSFLYIPRIYLNGFFDIGWSPGVSMMKTTGIELMTDFHIFNLPIPLQIGTRLVYNISNGKFRLEDTSFMIGIDLN